MTSPTPGHAPSTPPNRARRLILWLVVFGAIIIGVTLAFIYGPRVTPFLDVPR